MRGQQSFHHNQVCGEQGCIQPHPLKVLLSRDHFSSQHVATLQPVTHVQPHVARTSA